MPRIGSDELDEVLDRSPLEYEVNRVLSMVERVLGCIVHEPSGVEELGDGALNRAVVLEVREADVVRRAVAPM
jgi:hypothetical protein